MLIQTPLLTTASAGFRLPAWFWLGAGVYVLILVNGNGLLNDSDTYWHIAVGKWILDHNSFPRVDMYSFTKAGEPWISTSWLAQVLYAGTYEIGGWAGPTILAATCIAGTFALLAFIVGQSIRSTYAIMIALVALPVSASHVLARPHVLALPVMLVWVNGLVGASERREPPSFWLLPLMVLWANLHGGFVFGLALIVPIAFDAWWNAEASQRGPLALRWIVFGACAVVACCATPYGWGSILASRKILGLGELLNLISEWNPADFSHFSIFEACILALIAGSLYLGVKLSPAAAVDVLKNRGAKRVLNDLQFGGYLISRQMPVFIDGRAELYGEPFDMAYYRALQLKDVNRFLGILKDYEIDAVLLTPATPAASLLDHLDGWQRVYADEIAVVHIRTAETAREHRAN